MLLDTSFSRTTRSGPPFYLCCFQVYWITACLTVGNLNIWKLGNAWLIRQPPVQSGGCLIKIRRVPYRSGSNQSKIRRLPDWSGPPFVRNLPPRHHFSPRVCWWCYYGCWWWWWLSISKQHPSNIFKSKGLMMLRMLMILKMLMMVMMAWQLNQSTPPHS